MLKLLFLSLILYPMLVLGQGDTSYLLPTATVVSYLPSNLVQWDTSELQQTGNGSLTEQLQSVPELFVRNYGPGSLGTLSLMGGSSSHTGIKWQGISLRNPMLGQNDLSLMPTQIFEKVTLDVAGASAEHGNAQLNGTILISSEPKPSSGLKLAPEVGEWSRWGGWSEANWSWKGLRSQVKVYGQTGENDFRYRRTSGELARQSNARIRNLGLLQSNHWQDRRNRSHSLAIWWQDAYQRIPPLTTQSISEASQKTESVRVAVNWNEKGLGPAPSVTAGWIHEQIDFSDPRIRLTSMSSFHTASLHINRLFEVAPSSSLKIGINEQFLTATIENYRQSRSENQLELYGVYAGQVKRWQYRVAIRQGLVDLDLMPTTASIRVEGKVGQSFRILTSISRDTRFVTLNEKYWIPGGNEDLEEESSVAQTLKITYRPGASRGLTGHVMAFNRNTDNWIQWTPDGNQFIWSPTNLTAVWSRGFTLSLEHKLHSQSLRLSSLASYSLTKSTNREDISIPRLGSGEQLWYTPQHQANFEQKVSINNLQLVYLHKFTGAYNGIMGPVPSFHIAQLRAEWSRPWKSHLLQRIWLKVDNLFNEDYRMIENRPMPLRNVRIGLHLQVT